MTVSRVFLIVCVLVMIGASADASASSTASGTWTLTITFAGTGTGVVTTVPAGIVCANEKPSTPEGAVPQPLGTCSAQFPDDVSPWVIATPSGAVPGSFGSRLADISNCLRDTHGGILFNSCQAESGPVEVTFNARPVPCIVNRLIGDTLAKVKRQLRAIPGRCKVGTVRYVHSSRRQDGYVISQNPNPHWQRQHGAVNLVVGKGPRGSWLQPR
jgi:hypothetical protein